MSHAVATWPVLPATEAAGAILDRTASTAEPGVDLLLDDDGDLVVDSDAHFTTGLLAVAQGIRIRLQMFRGEWFRDLDRGVPYLANSSVDSSEALLGQRFNELRARNAFREAILDAPEVDELTSLEVTFDRATRGMSVAWHVKTDFGQISDSVEV